MLELLVVIAIIGLLSAYVAPMHFRQIGKSKTLIAQDQVDAFDKALQQYRLDTGHYPPMNPGLPALFVQPPNEPLWRGPYLKKGLSADPWGNGYIYRMPGTEGREVEVLSYGADGKQGGTAENADVMNWNAEP